VLQSADFVRSPQHFLSTVVYDVVFWDMYLSGWFIVEVRLYQLFKRFQNEGDQLQADFLQLKESSHQQEGAALRKYTCLVEFTCNGNTKTTKKWVAIGERLYSELQHPHQRKITIYNLPGYPNSAALDDIHTVVNDDWIYLPIAALLVTTPA